VLVTIEECRSQKYLKVLENLKSFEDLPGFGGKETSRNQEPNPSSHGEKVENTIFQPAKTRFCRFTEECQHNRSIPVLHGVAGKDDESRADA